MAEYRAFGTGATRDVDTGKFDYEGFLSPLVVEAFGWYMHLCRTTPTGLRDSDNWQHGIPLWVYMKSKHRHDMDMWKWHRGYPTHEHQIVNATAVLFNTMGYLHELLKTLKPKEIEAAFQSFAEHRAAEIAARIASTAPKSEQTSGSPKSGRRSKSRRAGRR
jgi:hypothetical protein